MKGRAGSILSVVHVRTLSYINLECRRIVKDHWNPYGRELQSYANPLHSRIFCKNKGNCLLYLLVKDKVLL